MIERWLPAAASSHAAALDAVLVGIHWHMLLIFAGWLALFVADPDQVPPGREPGAAAGGRRLAVAGRGHRRRDRR